MPVTKDSVLDFEAFALTQLEQGARVDSLDDLLDAYHLSRRTAEEASADLAAVRASLADMERGERGRPIEEFDADFRARNGLLSN